MVWTARLSYPELNPQDRPSSLAAFLTGRAACARVARPLVAGVLMTSNLRPQRPKCYTLSTVAQTRKGMPTMRENWVQSLGREDLLEKEMATQSSILAWKIPWTEEPSRLLSMGSQRVRHDFTFTLSMETASPSLSGPRWAVGFVFLEVQTPTSSSSSYLLLMLLLFSHYVRLFVSPWTAALQASLSFSISWSLLKLMSIESVMPSTHLILCRPLHLLPSVFPSIIHATNEKGRGKPGPQAACSFWGRPVHLRP